MVGSFKCLFQPDIRDKLCPSQWQMAEFTMSKERIYSEPKPDECKEESNKLFVDILAHLILTDATYLAGKAVGLGQVHVV